MIKSVSVAWLINQLIDNQLEAIRLGSRKLSYDSLFSDNQLIDKTFGQ